VLSDLLDFEPGEILEHGIETTKTCLQFILYVHAGEGTAMPHAEARGVRYFRSRPALGSSVFGNVPILDSEEIILHALLETLIRWQSLILTAFKVSSRRNVGIDCPDFDVGSGFEERITRATCCNWTGRLLKIFRHENVSPF
jgi:hypothetical protein